jgi:phage terminase large subunit
MIRVPVQKIPSPQLRGAGLELIGCRDLEVALDGPAGSGKTVAALFKVHALLLAYPGAKALVARKTNTALAGSAVATFRDTILDIRHNVHYFGGNKIKPAAFEYANGSLMIINGLDRPGKVKSWEFDVAYINEASECNVEDIEFVRSRLRNGKMPYHQLIMDTNPDAPMHWLNLRCNAGITTRLLSRHEDNPRYHDGRDWTEEGRAYIFDVLEGLTGVRLARLRYGVWAAAEGAVYMDSYDRARNVINPFPIPLEWPRWVVLDFGYTNPFVAKFYAEDPDGRLFMYREFYRTKTLVEDHVQYIKQVVRWGEKGGEPLPRAVIADHDAEDRETFTRHSGLFTIPAHKTVSDGIQAVASRLRPAGDGRPRLMYFNNALVEPDPELVRAKKPKCTIEEFDTYIWDTRQGMKRGELPVKDSDHGLDCDRYMCAYKDLVPSGVKYSSRIY